MSDYVYQGTELELFRDAVNWKRYWASTLRPYVRGSVLDIGAGIGATARVLCDQSATRWTCLEPDPMLCHQLTSDLSLKPLAVPTHVMCGTVADIPATELFDTIVYIDVLEHIENDRGELAASAQHVRSGGHLIVLAPAHNWLFSPFDAAVGHMRRYTTATLRAVAPEELTLVSAFYLDSVGMLASLANRMLLKAAAPSRSQIRFWDSSLVRLSRLLDPLWFWRLGKTVVAIWAIPSERPVRRTQDTH